MLVSICSLFRFLNYSCTFNATQYRLLSFYCSSNIVLTINQNLNTSVLAMMYTSLFLSICCYSIGRLKRQSFPVKIKPGDDSDEEVNNV